MTEQELMSLLNRGTGVAAAFVLFGLALGYWRVLDSDSALVRSIAWSIVLLTLASIVECLRVVPSAYPAVHTLAIIYNLTVLYAAYRGLQAMYRMIPDEDRQDWHWYSAPLYPPWAWVDAMERLVGKLVRRNRRRAGYTSERRTVRKPIDFPDRRRADDD